MNEREHYDSNSLFEKINLLSEAEINKISEGLKWTEGNLPDAVLIGGTATIHYICGIRYLTPDIDFMVNDIDNLKNKLNLNRHKYNNLDSGQGYVLGITVDEFNTDYLDCTAGNVELNKLILTTANTSLIGNYNVKIIDPELLAIVKLELGRDKDIGDGLLLLNSNKLDKNKYVNYLDKLKNTLYDYNTIYSYRNFID